MRIDELPICGLSGHLPLAGEVCSVTYPRPFARHVHSLTLASSQRFRIGFDEVKEICDRFVWHPNHHTTTVLSLDIMTIVYMDLLKADSHFLRLSSYLDLLPPQSDEACTRDPVSAQGSHHVQNFDF